MTTHQHTPASRPPWSARRLDEIDELDQARSFARVASALGVAVELPRVGPYSVLERIGTGGMGIVYAAFDVELRRRVAVKVLRPEHSDQHERVKKEARALARLSHPNVVAVHSVGVEDGRMYIAMALVDGSDMRSWVRTPGRTHEEILRAFHQAGLGLAAAHGAGVVHRDFKPANVLVDLQGRVRVADFGIASLDPTDADSEQGLLDSKDTRASGRFGTPAYMAPEQHAGEDVVPASDQFSFCVALVDVLDGQLPYEATTTAGLAEQKATGAFVRSSQTAVSDALWRVIERGLSPRPEDRYPSMKALLDAIEAARQPPTRRGTLFAVGGVAVAVTVALTVRQSAGTQAHTAAAPEPCTGFALQLVGVWDDQVRSEIHERLEETGLEHAEDVWRRTQSAFDAQARGWLERKQTACRAELAGELEPQEYDARQSCLDALFDELRASTETLRTLDRNFVLRMRDPFLEQPLEGCDVPWNAYWLQRRHPQDVEGARKVQAKMATGAAHLHAGRVEDAKRAYADARADIEASDELFPSVRAELSRRQSQLEPDPTRKQELLDEALHDALRTHHPRIAVPTTMDYATHLRLHGAPERARELIELGLAENRRYAAVFEEDPSTSYWAPGFEAELWVQLGQYFNGRGQPREALGAYRRSAAALEPVAPDFPTRRVNAQNNIGEVLGLLGEPEAADRAYAKAVAIAETELGAHDPLLGEVLGNRAGAAIDGGRPNEALQDIRRSIAILEGTQGPQARTLVVPIVNLGLVQHARGELDDAHASLTRAIEIASSTYGDPHPFTAYARGMLGAVLREQGRLEQSIEHLDVAVTAMQRAFPNGHALLGSMFAERAETRATLGRLDDAFSDAQAALRTFDASGGKVTAARAAAQTTLAKVLHLQGRTKQAHDHASAAIEQLSALGPEDRPELKRAREVMARIEGGAKDG